MKSKNFKFIILTIILIISLTGCKKRLGDEINVQTVKDGTETIGDNGTEGDEYITEDMIQEGDNGSQLDLSQLVQAKNNVEKIYEKLVGILSDKLDGVILSYDPTKDRDYVLRDIELVTESNIELTDENVGEANGDEIELEIIDGELGEGEMELIIVDGDIELDTDLETTSELHIDGEDNEEIGTDTGQVDRGVEEERDKYEIDFEDLEMMAVLDDIQAGFNELDTIRAQIEAISTKIYSQGYTKQSEIDMDTNLLNSQISHQIESLIEEYK